MKAIDLFRERALFILLGALIISLFLTNLPDNHSGLEATIFSVVVTIGVAAGSAAVATNSFIAWTAGILTFAIILFRFISYLSQDVFYECVSSLLTILLVALIVERIAKRVFDKRDVTREKIVGAVTIYLLIGIIWGNIYTLIALNFNNAFQFNGVPFEFSTNFYIVHKELIYYSFVTLTTVGFGDITALSPIARSFTILEACIGVLFPSILIARLVSLEIMHSQNSKKN